MFFFNQKPLVLFSFLIFSGLYSYYTFCSSEIHTHIYSSIHGFYTHTHTYTREMTYTRTEQHSPSEGCRKHLRLVEVEEEPGRGRRGCSQTALEWIALLESRQEEGRTGGGGSRETASCRQVVGKVSFMHLIAPNAVKD